MKVYCTGTARIRHCYSGEVHRVESDELDWDAVGGDERQMGTEVHYEAVLDHSELGTLTWGLWEYPEGIQNHRVTDVGGHQILADFEYGLAHEDPGPDFWLDDATPPNPFEVFLDSYHLAGDLLAENGKADGTYLLNRMVFSHQVTALEAYLGDTLINAVTADASARERLVKGAEELASEKFTLAEVLSDPSLVERKVRDYLRAILYHNLAKVDVLYNIAVGFRILPLATDTARLFRAVVLRHDCVHRNGFGKDGAQLVELPAEFRLPTVNG